MPRHLGRRTVVVYLVGIALPALGLLWLAWRSIDQQRAALRTLAERNLELSLERLASDVESRVTNLAGACALDDGFQAISDGALQDGSGRPGTIAEKIRGRHPVASHVFLALRGTLQYPSARAPLLKSPTDIASGSKIFAALFARAEQAEADQEGAALAARLYERAAALPEPSALRALALARLARCRRRLGAARDAGDVWRRLASTYRDERDLLSLPYGLVAGTEIETSPPDVAVTRAYDDLVSGRWVLAAEQVDEVLPVLETRLRRTAAQRPDTAYLAEHRFAMAALVGVQSLPAAGNGQIRAASFGADDQYPVGYVVRDGRITGCALDLGWIAGMMLPSLAGASSLHQPVRVTSLRAAGVDRRADISSRFSAILRGYALTTSALPPENTPWAWAFGGATLLTIGALALGVMLLLRDVTRQGETNRLQQQLVSGVSHELKTPLTLIRVYAETLAADPDTDPADRSSYFRIIVRETERLAELIERVLNFSRIDVGQRAYRLAPEDVGSIVRQTTDSYAEFLGLRGFSMELSIADDLPTVRCDRDAIAEAIINLLDNAAKYSGDARAIEVSVFRRDNAVVVEVADHGIGIEASEHARVFERFYRGSAQSGRGGYGLGLYLVKHTLDGHGGSVELASTPGRGSRFRLVLPSEA